MSSLMQPSIFLGRLSNAALCCSDSQQIAVNEGAPAPQLHGAPTPSLSAAACRYAGPRLPAEPPTGGTPSPNPAATQRCRSDRSHSRPLVGRRPAHRHVACRHTTAHVTRDPRAHQCKEKGELTPAWSARHNAYSLDRYTDDSAIEFRRLPHNPTRLPPAASPPIRSIRASRPRTYAARALFARPI